MDRYKVYGVIVFSVYIVLAEKNADSAEDVSPRGITDKTSRALNSESLERKTQNYLTERATDENVIEPLMQINPRTRREIRTLVDMQRENARKLEKLTNGVERLIETPIFKENMTSFIENLTSNVEFLLKTAPTKDDMAPLFISIFVMLADVALSTSPRIGKNQTDFMNTLEYFGSNIETVKDYPFMVSKMQSVLTWYTHSCLDILNSGFKKSGVYTIKIPITDRTLKVYCDQETDNGGWLVFQRRQDGSEDFYRSWEDYGRGFGHIEAEFWLGNDNLHELTKTAQELRVDLLDFEGNTAYAKYSSFSVGSSSVKFILSVSGYSGTAGDSLDYHNGSSFTTKDNDNDNFGSNCAADRQGAWWFKSCNYSHLNGLYYNSSSSNSKSVMWYYWKNKIQSLKWTEMKLRPTI